jgi:Tfp pilus tip-associated adhesin PilY1
VAGDVTLVDLDGDGNVDAGYFADTAGNLYRINFTDAGLAGLASDDDATPDAFTVTRIAYTTGSGRKFLYAPAAVVNAGRVILALGSGDREHPLIDDYPYTTPVLNRFYVFVDHPLDTVTTPVNLDDTSVMKDMSTPPDDVCNFNIADNATFRGWFMDLCGLCDPSDPANDKGEQTVTSALIQAGIVFFSTNRPLPDTTDVCTGNLGEARGYAVNLVNSSGVIQADGLCGGKRSNVFLNGGLPPSPVAAHVPIRMADGTVIVTAVLGGIQIDGTPSSVIGGQQVKPRIKSKRRIVYWHTDSD